MSQSQSPLGNPVCPQCNWPVMGHSKQFTQDGVVWHSNCHRIDELLPR